MFRENCVSVFDTSDSNNGGALSPTVRLVFVFSCKGFYHLIVCLFWDALIPLFFCSFNLFVIYAVSQNLQQLCAGFHQFPTCLPSALLVVGYESMMLGLESRLKWISWLTLIQRVKQLRASNQTHSILIYSQPSLMLQTNRSRSTFYIYQSRTELIMVEI